MKNFIIICLMSVLAMTTFSCNNTGSNVKEGNFISGKIENAENIKIFVDRVSFNPQNPNKVVGSGDADASGSFNFELMDMEPAFYRIRAGQKNMMFVLTGDEKQVKINANLNDLDRFNATFEGAPAATEFVTALNGLMNRKLKLEDIKAIINNTKYPIVALGVTLNAFRNDKQFLDIHKKVLGQFTEAYPNAGYTTEYAKFVNGMINTPKEAISKGPVAIGQPAPDIVLPDVNGKTMKLSDLKGKLVLLDFWASWCGPCRRENPNVVKIYNKYKSQGFTVFSVSLDGIDGRTKQKLESSGRSVDDYIASQKKRWLGAIAQDKLIWKNHVSDLKKWDSAPVRAYGVTSIPKSFLVGKDGKIVEIGLRGARALEEAIKKHL